MAGRLARCGAGRKSGADPRIGAAAREPRRGRGRSSAEGRAIRRLRPTPEQEIPALTYDQALLAFLLHAAGAAGLVALALGLSARVGARREAAVGGPFESGVRPIGFARMRVSTPFFLVAAFFVVFDMEAAILFAWAVAVREAGLQGLIEATVFIGVLLAGLVYLWADGALEWGPRRERGRP